MNNYIKNFIENLYFEKCIYFLESKLGLKVFLRFIWYTLMCEFGSLMVNTVKVND